MKKVCKKLVSIIVTTTIFVSITVPAFALTYDNWASSWYTPYYGIASFHDDYISGTSLKWSADQINEFSYGVSPCWELEFRPYLGASAIPDNEVQINQIYDLSVAPDFVSTMPGAYYECSSSDLEDVAIGTSNPNQLVADRAYNSYLYLEKNYSGSPDYRALLESEFGFYLFVDGLPQRLAQWGPLLEIGSSQFWNNR